MREYQIELATIDNGTLSADFDAEVAKVIDNLRDPNTLPDSKRSITLKVSFSTGVERKKITLKYRLDTKLANPPERSTDAWIVDSGGRRRLTGIDLEQAEIPGTDGAKPGDHNVQ